jgi:hypothetical protein
MLFRATTRAGPSHGHGAPARAPPLDAGQRPAHHGGIPRHGALHLDFGSPLQEAIEQPRARLWDGRLVEPEARFEPRVLEALAAREACATTSAARK